MRRASRLLSLAAVLCFAIAAHASDREVRDDAHHCRFERPEGWTTLGAEVLEDFHSRVAAIVKALGTDQFESIAAFGAPHGEDGRPLACFTAIFSPWTSRPRTYAGLERRFSKEMLGAGGVVVAALMTETAPHIDDVVVDRERGRLRSHGTMAVDVGDIATYGVGLPGKDGVVWLHAFAQSANASVAWTLLDGVADSFRWDEGHEFHEDVVSTADVAGARPWRDDAHRWSVTLPDGWSVRHRSEAAQPNAAGSIPQPGDGFSRSIRFAPANAEECVDPVVIVGWVPGELHRATWTQLEHTFGIDDFRRRLAKQSFGIGEVRGKFDVGFFVFDEQRRCMTAEYSCDLAGLRWKGLWISFFGRDGGAHLIYRAMEKDFETARPTFDALVDSFRFDDGFRWGDSAWSIDWKAFGTTAAVVAGIGALVGATFWLVRAREAKHATARARERLSRPSRATVRP
jgi:hypothetical protein